jgi:thiamine kinase-like enzyme
MRPHLDSGLAAVMRAVPTWAGHEPDAVMALAAGITNRNYRVDVAGGSYVVRLFGEDTEALGIDRAAECEAARAAARAGVGPEVVAFLPDHRALVTRFLDAEPLAPAAVAREDVLERVVAAIRTIHALPPIPSRFWPFRIVREYQRIAAGRGVAMPPTYPAVLARADEIEAAFRAAPGPTVVCHNDLLSANFLVRDDRIYVVDYEYAGMGDPFFDLGNFAVNHGLSEPAETVLLRRYLGAVGPADVARLRLMRIMSDFREAMWGVAQQALSRLDVDYAAYASRHFERGLASAADDRYPSWLAGAARGRT